MAAQPLPYFPLRTSHKQSNLRLPTHSESLLLTRQFTRVHVYFLTKSVFSLPAFQKQQCVLQHQLDWLLYRAVFSALRWESVVNLSGKCFIFGHFLLHIRVLFSAIIPRPNTCLVPICPQMQSSCLLSPTLLEEVNERVQSP